MASATPTSPTAAPRSAGYRVTAVLVMSMPLTLALPGLVAHPCDPGPIYFVAIERSDAPACVTITPRRRASLAPSGSTVDPTRVASVDIENRCSEPVDFEVAECAACGDGKQIAAGATSQLVLETRPQGDAVDYGKHTKQVWRWRMGAATGSVASDVTVRDDLEACRGERERDREADGLLSGCGG